MARFIKDLSEIAKKKDVTMRTIELKDAKQTQNAPSIYATFNLVYNGRLLSDHYISNKSFLNIIDKEIT